MGIFLFTGSGRLIDIFKDWTWLARLLTLLIIPFRITNLNFQWAVAAIAYILQGLSVFEYALIFWLDRS